MSAVGTALSDARELYATLQQIEEKLGQVKEKSVESRVSVLELYQLFNALMGLLRKAGLPENVVSAIDVLQRLATTAYAAYTAVIALETATPIGWAIIGIGTLTMGLSMATGLQSHADRVVRR